MSCNIDDTALCDYTENLRRQYDNALQISGTLKAYKNITLYRYSVEETDMKDETKTLIDTVKNLTIFLDYPGDISNLSSNTPFIEDVLPLTVMFPWYFKNRLLKVDILDEFIINLTTEFGEKKPHRFEITDRLSTYEGCHLERHFIVAPKRESTVDFTDKYDNDSIEDGNPVPPPDGIVDDPNDLDQGNNEILSDYDDY